MNRRVLSSTRWLVTMSLLLLAMISFACESPIVSDGIRAYLGVVPAEIARASLTQHVSPARDAHGRPIAPGEEHHFVIALFDNATGARIENAEVSATLFAPGKYKIGKRLEPMRINDTVTYGAAFDVAAGVEHHFDVDIRVPSREKSVSISFRYRDPHGSAP